MRPIPSLGSSLKASRSLSRLVGKPAGRYAKGLLGTGSDSPRLRPTCVYLKSSRDRSRTSGRSVWGGLQIHA